MIPAIETQYKGYRFRSRTEARWAVFFDAIGIDWEYEKEGYNLGAAGLYLPDFWLPLPLHRYPHAGYFIEIKGIEPADEYLDKLRILSRETKHSVWCFVGEPGKQRRFTAHNSGHSGWYNFTNEESTRPDRFLWDLWSVFNRWWTCGIMQPQKTWGLAEACNGVVAARSARFEHGETPQVYR